MVQDVERDVVRRRRGADVVEHDVVDWPAVRLGAELKVRVGQTSQLPDGLPGLNVSEPRIAPDGLPLLSGWMLTRIVPPLPAE